LLSSPGCLQVLGLQDDLLHLVVLQFDVLHLGLSSLFEY